MNKQLTILVTALLAAGSVFCQATGSTTVPPPATKAVSNAFSLGFVLPAGYFNQTHGAGISVDYAYSRNRFGRAASGYPLLKFIMNGAASYQPGKKESTAGYVFQYGSYITVAAMGGMDCKPADPLHVSLVAGPVMSFYKTSVEAGTAIHLLSTYYVSKNLSVGPGILYKKFSKANALWSATIRASYFF